MHRLVSVIMPAYNAEKYIASSIRSVIDQTYSHWELIVVDDGSTDRTAEIVRDLSPTDERITLVYQQNGGQASARNTGIKNSRGDLIAFLDADDLWIKEKLDLQLLKMDETGADIVYSDGQHIHADGEPSEDEHFAVVPGRVEAARMFKLLYEYNRIQIQSVLARRDLLERAGLFDEDRRLQNCEDYDLWLKLARADAVFYGMEEKLIRYRRHAGASTFQESNVLRPMIAVMKKHADQSSLGRDEVTTRIRNLYRSLLAALVRENRLTEANASMREFAAWDRGSWITKFQRVLLGVWPRRFNFISRECLFRIEWHAARLLGTRHAGTTVQPPAR